MHNMPNKFASSLAALLWVFLNLVLANASAAPATENNPLIPREQLFMRKPGPEFLRLNANATLLAYLDRSTNKLMVADANCPECTDKQYAIALPDGGSPYLFFWTKFKFKMVVVYFSPAKKRMDVAVYDLLAKEFTALFLETEVKQAFVDASPKYFYSVPTVVFKVEEANNEPRYFKIDFERGERNEVSLKNNILEIERHASGIIGVDTTSVPKRIQWYFTDITGRQQALASIDEIDQLLSAGFLTSYTDKKGARHALFLNANTTDTLALIDYNLTTGKPTTIARDKADIERILLKPHGPAEAYVRNYLKPEWVALDPAMNGTVKFFNQQSRPVSAIESRSADDSRWIILQRDAIGRDFPVMYDRSRKTLKPIVLGQTSTVSTVSFDGGIKVRAEVVPARDKTPLVSYLTTPSAQTCTRNDCPMVVLLHGGPRLRDEYPSSPIITWLANRGYAVLTVNYRGSRGFGKKLEALNIGQWGLAMQDDVLDAVTWAINKKVADPKRIAVMGGSHGGFLAINSITVAPDQFACAVASGATGNLASFVEKVTTVEPRLGADLFNSVGDVRIPEVKAALLARSPISKIAAVKVPVFITHGGKDQLAPLSDMEDYAAALAAQGGKLGFVVFPEEGHGLVNQATKLASYGMVENFLAACLGGRHEPVLLDLGKAKIDVRMGQENYPFLKE